MNLTKICLVIVLFSCSTLLLKAVAIELEFHKMVVKLEPSGIYFVERGRDIELKCSVESNKLNYYLHWKFNGRFHNHINQSKLLIENVQADNSGLYSCVVWNKEGPQVEVKVVVNVLYGPENFHPLHLNVEEGKTVSISCTVHSQPAPDSVSWKKFGNYGLEFETTGPHLLFISVKKSQAGTYICRSANKLFLNGTEPVQRISMTKFLLTVTEISKSQFQSESDSENLYEFDLELSSGSGSGFDLQLSSGSGSGFDLQLGSGSGSRFDSTTASGDGPNVKETDFFFIPSSSNFSSLVKNKEENFMPTTHGTNYKNFETNPLANAVRIIGMCFGISYGSIFFVLSLLYFWSKKRTLAENEAQDGFNV